MVCKDVCNYVIPMLTRALNECGTANFKFIYCAKLSFCKSYNFSVFISGFSQSKMPIFKL